MHIIYTLNTTPLLNGRFGINGKEIVEKTIWMFALSIGWINQWYTDITIYTDSLGEELLKGVPGEFNVISKSHIELWSLSKIDSIKNQIGPFCHIDGDLIMRQPVDLSTESIMCDRIEIDNFHHQYTPWLSLFNSFEEDKTIKWWEKSEAWAPNCGIISIGNSSIMKTLLESIEKYTKLYWKYKNTTPKTFRQNILDPNCVVEQFGIRRGCEIGGIEIEFLTEGVNQIEQRQSNLEKGYYHYYGIEKYNNEIIKEVKRELLSLFPHIHKRIKNNLKKYKGI